MFVYHASLVPSGVVARGATAGGGGGRGGGVIAPRVGLKNRGTTEHKGCQKLKVCSNL